MQSALLIGNGLNRCYKGAIPWDQLLEDIARKYQVRFNPRNPFPLEFESIANQVLDRDDQTAADVYGEIKSKIADMVSSQAPTKDSLHKLFVSDIPANHILTTNYDYMLERAYLGEEPQKPIESDKSEIKYSRYRFERYANKAFYHIHGEAKRANTLCLGYEHYAGYLAKMRKYLKDQPSVDRRISRAELPEKDSWVNLFFTHDIYIVGLTLDTNEIDLWWLLTYRAFLYYSNDSGLRSIMKNRVRIYITSSDPKKSAEIESKQELFQNLHVESEIVKVSNGDYEYAYQRIAEKIKQEINARR